MRLVAHPARREEFGRQIRVASAEDLSLPGEWAWVGRFPQRLKNPLVMEAPGSHEGCFTRPAELAGASIRACAA